MIAEDRGEPLPVGPIVGIAVGIEKQVSAPVPNMLNEVTAHGFRSTASTLLNETGRWNPDAIERQLAHQEENGVRRAYIHAADFWVERVAMMQEWADYLDQLRAGATVIPLHTAHAANA